MKKRQLFSVFLLVVLGLAVFNGCEDVAQVQTPVSFASLRVANFDNSCLILPTSYDVYVYPVGQASELPIIRGGLDYGDVSPWIDNLATNRDAGLTYKVDVTAVGNTTKVFSTEITLKPGDKQTLWIFRHKDEATPEYKFISDDPADDNPPLPIELTKAYFRFINTEADAGPLTLKVNDAQGNTLGNVTVNYKEYTPYQGFTSTTIDTTLTFFIVNGNGDVVGRLAGVALESGTYKTVTWGGDCPAKYDPQEDPNAVKPDSTRVRILNDAGDGGDETKVPPQTMRYFFVNALIPPTYDNITNLVDYQELGVVVNNDNRYNFGPLAPYSVGPAPVSVNEGVMSVIPTSTLLTDAINVKGYVYNAQSPKSGALLFDYLAGPRADIKTDQLVALVLSDTVRKHTPGTKHPLDSAKGQIVVPIPDQPRANEATFVVLNMLASPSSGAPSANKALFFINENPIDNTSGGNWNPKHYEVINTSGGLVTLKAQVNNSVDETVTSQTFNAENGGIYLVILVGRRNSRTPEDVPKFMVIRTNPKY